MCVSTLLLSVALGGVSCKQSDRGRDNPARRAAGDAWFEEDAVRAGLRFTHVNAAHRRFAFPEIMPGGVGLLDYDGDGGLDVYLVQSGDLDATVKDRPRNRMFRNRGDGTFEDVTDATGTDDDGYGMGCACGDFDGDGFVDIYVTNVGPNVLYRNNGDGSFTDVTSAAGVAEARWSASAAFADYDGDGDLDLFVTNYVDWSMDKELDCRARLGQKDYCHPNAYRAPAPDTLYRNNGDQTFTDVSETAGLRSARGNGLGVVSADFNGDGRVDFYVANDATPNRLWINDGDDRFHDDGLLSGSALNRSGAAEGGMGVIAADFECDCQVDLFLSHLRDETNTFYRNHRGVFSDVTASLGLEAPSLPFTGFGLGFADFDNDGRRDIFVANGRVTLTEPMPDPARPYAEENQLFRGVDGGRFEEVFPRGGTATSLMESSRGAAFGDLDNDGDIDVIVANLGGPLHFLRNITGARRHWVMFRVLHRRGGYAIGASVHIEAAGRAQCRLVQRAYSYCASNDPRVHFGLGNSPHVERVRVRWPGGEEESFGGFEANGSYELREGKGRPVVE